MTGFPLKIVTPDGIAFDGQAQRLVVRTTSGDVAIMARHVNFVAPLGMGRATVTVAGETRYGAGIGGRVSVVNGEVTLVPTTFEWADSIDVARAEASLHRAEETLDKKDATNLEISLAEARLKRALLRTNVAKHK